MYLIGNFSDDDLPETARQFFFEPTCAYAETATARRISFGYRLFALDNDTTGRKIGSRHQFGEFSCRRIRIFDEVQGRFAQLKRVMRRDAGRHANRNACRSIGEQIGESPRQHHRLFFTAVISLAKINGIFVQTVEQQSSDFGHARFGISHGSRIIAVDIAKIALPVDHRIAHRKILREAHKCVINRLVAMRVIFADHVADNARALLKA